jgi:tRNA pseudouridine55 synthase
MVHPCDGILLVDKKEGETSFSVVRKVRSAFGVRKVGHAGTLDPFATGLLVVLVGQATKLSAFLMGGVKQYRATITLGTETDTMDPTGRVIRTSPVPSMEPGFIKECALSFRGEIEQVPPVFSAVKYRGKRAYDLARKGIKVDLGKRSVEIYRLEVEAIDLPDLTVTVACSGGTYMRSLAADLGRRLGTGGHLKVLRRLSSGCFSVAHALSSERLGAGCSLETLEQRMIPLHEALPEMEEIQVDHTMASRIRQGYQPKWEELKGVVAPPPVRESHVKLVKGNELVAIVKTGRAAGAGASRLEGVRVFHPSTHNQ